jgi:Lrp/AsnC family leucine-responsive transcriptional regulator
MDRIDKEILGLLQQDASQSNAQLAGRIGLAPSSCLRRVQRLKKAGVIQRVAAVLNPAKVDRRIQAIVTVELQRHAEVQTRAFLTTASGEAAVQQAYSVTGQTDVVLILRLADMEEFEALCERLFTEQNNVVRYYTMIVKGVGKETTMLPL